jgi:hypothetical protein
MNCRDFESNVLGLDRGEAPGAGAVEHAASCAACREELQAIEDLQRALSDLARHDAAIDAPVYLEASLLKKLAQDGKQVRATGVTTRWARSRRLRFAIAAAAAAIMVAAVIAVVRWNFVRPNPGAPVGGGHEIQTGSPEPGAHKDDSKNSLAVKPDAVKPEMPDQRAAAGGGVAKDREGNKPSRGMKRAAAHPAGREDFEIATDYFPIDVGSFMQPIDGGQIVRIKLPRSALRSYGLPVDPMRADEAVKADVVLGNDGMARAIRFVR